MMRYCTSSGIYQKAADDLKVEPYTFGKPDNIITGNFARRASRWKRDVRGSNPQQILILLGSCTTFVQPNPVFWMPMMVVLKINCRVSVFGWWKRSDTAWQEGEIVRDQYVNRQWRWLYTPHGTVFLNSQAERLLPISTFWVAYVLENT